MANKRIKKKQAKAAAQEAARIKAQAKERRAAATTRRYNENIAFLENLRIPTNIITKSVSKAETKRRAEKYLQAQAEAAKAAKAAERKRKASERYAYKVNRLIDAGLSRADAEKQVGTIWKQKSNKAVEAVASHYYENTPRKAKNGVAFYVGFADISGAGFHVEDNDVETSLHQIQERLEECQKGMDAGSDSRFRGAFIVKMGAESTMEKYAYNMYQRSVNFSKEHPKFDGKQYHKITVSNEWSRRDFLNMVNSCIQQMPPRDVPDFYKAAKDYCKKAGYDYL